MAKLEIAQIGLPILRTQAQFVKDVKADVICELIDSLMETLIEANGVGIAAPQVSKSDRLFIVASRPNPRYPNAPLMQPTVMINPQIIAHSEEIVKGFEGCLSVPGVRGKVPRYQSIEVEYTDREGKLQQKQLTDFIARIFQHELDHLNGILFIDRLESSEDRFTEAEYQEIMANQS